MTEVSSTTSEEIETFLYSYPHKRKEHITCKFFLTACNLDTILEEELIDFLLDRLIYYVLPYDEYGELEEKLKKRMFSLLTKAISKFKITRKGKKMDGSEVAELLLFVLLESETIIQLVHKMSLKTTRGMHVFGVDAIHLEVRDSKFYLHFGECKLYEDFSDAVSKAVSDIGDLYEDNGKRKFEINIISSLADFSRFGEYSSIIKDLVSPYPSNPEIKRNCGDVNDIFIGYQWDISSKEIKCSNLGKVMSEEFLSCHDDLFNRIYEKKELIKRPCNFYILPIKNVTSFQELFLKRLNLYEK